MLLEPPRTLPVKHLSPSSVSLFKQCPEKWKRRYIDREYESTSPAALLGTVVGAAERDSFNQKIETGLALTTVEVLDAYTCAWDLTVDREGDNVDWDGERPGRVKDSGARVLPVYHRHVAPTVNPIATERRFTVRPADVDWTFEGYFDVEEEDAVDDVKVRGRQRGLVSAEEAQGSYQATAYLFARRAEGNPARRGFAFHNLVRPPKSGEVSPRDVLVTPTHRTDEQLDAFLIELYEIAAEIAWRAEYEVWTGPPRGVWWCSQRWCGYWQGCRFGGALLGTQPEPRRARPPGGREVITAVSSTALKSGKTTAAKVAAHLGVSTRQAASLLAAQAKAGRLLSEQPTRSSGRGKDKVVKTIGGPRTYRVPPAPAPEAEQVAA